MEPAGHVREMRQEWKLNFQRVHLKPGPPFRWRLRLGLCDLTVQIGRCALAPTTLHHPPLRIATLAALRWRPRTGFVAFCFFAILAPSSSVVPLVTQTAAEHRMYLPLAALAVLTVLAAHRALGARATLLAAATLSLGLAGVSAARNRIMQDDLAIWADTIAKRPGNSRAHASYALALSHRGRAAPPKRFRLSNALSRSTRLRPPPS